MENTIKFRKQIFEEMMREDKDPKNRENWEKLCCSQTPLVPFIGAGVSAWCYPMWNELLKEVVKDNFSDSCAAAVEKALECRQKPFVEEEDKFHWMEEIAECIFNDKPSPEEKRRFAPLAPPLEQGNQASEKERKLHREQTAATEVLIELRTCFQEYGPSKKRAAVNSLHDSFSEQRLLENRKNPEYQKFFPKVFTDILITTNYDKALERCYPSIFSYSYRDLHGADEENQSWLFQAVKEKLEQMQNRLDGKPARAASVSVPNVPMLLKVHGSIEQASDIALTRAKYDEAYSGEMPELFQEFCERSTMIFIGCGLREDRILDKMRELRAKPNSPGFCHFAFCAQPGKDAEETKERKRERLEEYGIYPIFYDKDSLEGFFSPKDGGSVCHEYYLGLLLENLYRRKMCYPQPPELLWNRSRFETWDLKAHLRNIRKNQLLKSESQYIHVEEARQIRSLLRASNECPLIAVTGRTGSGKSTFCQNLQRLDAEGKDAMQFFYIPLEDCKTWGEFCIQIYQVLNMIQPEILGPKRWREVAAQVAERCGGYWRSVLILDHLDELKGSEKGSSQWEAIQEMLLYWKEHQTRVVFTCRDYPDGISCHTWPIGTLNGSDAEKVFFSACTSKQLQNISYLERTVLGNLFSRQAFRPASVHLLGRYANSKNDLTSLLEEWESCHLPGDSEAQTIARIFTRHLLSEHRYEEKRPEEQRNIANNILWLWGILGTYPGRVPSVFFKNALRRDNGCRSMDISMDTLIYMKNAGICKEWSDEKYSALLENLCSCAKRFFRQLGRSDSRCEPLSRWFEEAAGCQGQKGLECFRGYSMDRYDGGLRPYVFEELKSELHLADLDEGDPNKAILELLKTLSGQVNSAKPVDRQLNQALHYEIKTVIRFLLARLPDADEEDRQSILEIGCGLSSYFHYVPNHAFPLVRELLDILDLEDAGDLNDRAKLYRVMGDIQRLLGKKKEALCSYQEAIRLCERQMVRLFGKDGCQTEYEECLRIKARTLIIRNYYAAGVAGKEEQDDMKEAKGIYKKLSDTWGMAYYCQRSGEALVSAWEGTELTDVIEKYNRAIQLYAREKDCTGISYMLKCMGDLIQKMRDSWNMYLAQENDTYCVIVPADRDSGIDCASNSWCYASAKCYALAFLMYCRQINWRGFANVLQAMANAFRTRGEENQGQEESGEAYRKRCQERDQAVEDLYSLSEECYRWMGDIRGLADTLDYLGYYYEDKYKGEKGEQYKDMARSKWMESRKLWERQGNDRKAAVIDKKIHELSRHRQGGNQHDRE